MQSLSVVPDAQVVRQKREEALRAYQQDQEYKNNCERHRLATEDLRWKQVCQRAARHFVAMPKSAMLEADAHTLQFRAKVEELGCHRDEFVQHFRERGYVVDVGPRDVVVQLP